MDTRDTLDVNAAVLDAAAYFESPMQVIEDSRLSKREKQRILESWAHDAELLSQADAENMAGPDRSRLREVRLALLELRKPA